MRAVGLIEPGLLDEAGLAVTKVVQPHLRAPMVARLSALRTGVAPEVAADESADAIAVATAIDDLYVRSFTLAKVSAGLAVADAPAALRAARAAWRAAKAIPDMHSKTIALAEAGGALSAVDRTRADRALAEAESLADAACSCRRRCLLAAVLERVASQNPEDALAKADLIPDPQLRGRVLARAIPRLAAVDPRRAVALMEHVPDLHEQIEGWVSLCDVFSSTDSELAVFAAECAEADAGFSHNKLVRLMTLARVARSVHRADPVRARVILTAAETAFADVEHSHQRSVAAAELARAQAVSDLDAGLRTARQIVHVDVHADALLRLAEDLKSPTGRLRPPPRPTA